MTKEIKTVALTSLKSLGGMAPVFDLPVKIDRIDGTPDIVEVLNALGRYHLAVYTTANQERDTYPA